MTATAIDLSVADVVGSTIAAQETKDAFGVIGSGNLIATNALARDGVRFHHARHEGGAVCMADGYARVSGRVGVVSVHQGPGLTNTITGLAEAAKSRTPLLVLAGETPATALTSNFRIDQHDLVESVGAIADRVHSAKTAADDAMRAHQRAQLERRPVVLMLPIDIQAQAAAASEPSRRPLPPLPAPEPARQRVEAIADLIADSARPAIIAGRGAVLAEAREEIEQLGQRIGAILATSAPANGLFAGLPYSLGISGGFASPLAAELLTQADLVLVFGASVNYWTTKHGTLINRDAKVVQIDTEPQAIGRNLFVDAGVVGDVRATATALDRELRRRGHAGIGFRTPTLAHEIERRRWYREPYTDASSERWIDPRTLTIELNKLLPSDRAIALDSGHFVGYPSMYLDVGDPRAWLFANGFQAVGLGVGNAIGAAIARPDRPTIAAIGDGGAFMALSELETAARLNCKLLVLIYDDAAFSAEVHHFEPMGHDVSLVRFPEVDLAAIGTASGTAAAVVRSVNDLPIVRDWLQERQPRPLVLDAKVNPTVRAEWIAEAFRLS